MKHLKNIILEKRDFKSYNKYINILNDIFEKIITLEKNHTYIYKDNDMINIQLKTWYSIKKNFIIFCDENFGNIDYKISPANGSQLIIEFFNVPLSALEKFEIEINSKKYNL